MEAFNTGDTSKVQEFISAKYINRELQSAKDSYRSKLRGSEEFVDTIKNYKCRIPIHQIQQQDHLPSFATIQAQILLPILSNQLSYDQVF
jgi:hypothetical protein